MYALKTLNAGVVSRRCLQSLIMFIYTYLHERVHQPIPLLPVATQSQSLPERWPLDMTVTDIQQNTQMIQVSIIRDALLPVIRPRFSSLPRYKLSFSVQFCCLLIAADSFPSSQ